MGTRTTTNHSLQDEVRWLLPVGWKGTGWHRCRPDDTGSSHSHITLHSWSLKAQGFILFFPCELLSSQSILLPHLYNWFLKSECKALIASLPSCMQTPVLSILVWYYLQCGKCVFCIILANHWQKHINKQSSHKAVGYIIVSPTSGRFHSQHCLGAKCLGVDYCSSSDFYFLLSYSLPGPWFN